MSEEDTTTDTAKETPEAETPAPDSAGTVTTEAPPATEETPAVEPTTETETEAAPERVVPESYELKLAKETHLDESDIKRVSEYSKLHQLTQEEAVRVLEHENAVAQSVMDRKIAEFKKEINTWPEIIKNDKEIGQDKFNESMELAKRYIESYADTDFVKDMVDSGYANHPGFVRMIVRAAKDVGEGKFIKGSNLIKPKDKSIAERLYGPGTEVTNQINTN